MSNTHYTPIAPTNDDDADKLTVTLRQAAHAYYQTEHQLMTDAEYDAGIDSLTTYAAQNPDWQAPADLLTEVAAGTAPAAGDVTHPTPMLSLAKANTLEEVNQFLTTTNGTVIVEPKLDGLAVRAVYTAGRLTLVATRGNGATGENVTARAKNIKGLPTTIKEAIHLEVRGEVFITDTDFPIANNNRIAAGKPAFVNSRNAVAGALRNENADYTVPMTFAAYDASNLDEEDHTERMTVLTTLGFQPAINLIPGLNSQGTITDRIERVGSMRPTLGFPIDGVVIKNDSGADRTRLGATSHSPRWALAYKYAAETATTTVKDITTSVGRTGRLAIRIEVEPVFVAGTTITYATGHNVSWMQERDIRIGDTVTIRRANDVIPYIDAVDLTKRPADAQRWEPPATDPMGKEWDKSTLLWRSTSPELSVLGRVVYAAHRDCLDIDGLGIEVATALIDAGYVGDIADLFSLDGRKVAELNLWGRRLGELAAGKIMLEIDQARSAPFNRVITALGVRMTGRTMGRRLAAAFPTMERLLAATPEDLGQVEGIGPKKAAVIHEGLHQLEGVIARLAEAGVNMGSEPAEADAADLPLTGMTVVVTGAMTGPLAGTGRTAMNELIEEAGGKASGSVSGKTSLLVSGEASGSKYAKAVSLGVRILSPEEFAQMLGR